MYIIQFAKRGVYNPHQKLHSKAARREALLSFLILQSAASAEHSSPTIPPFCLHARIQKTPHIFYPPVRRFDLLSSTWRAAVAVACRRRSAPTRRPVVASRQRPFIPRCRRWWRSLGADAPSRPFASIWLHCDVSFFYFYDWSMRSDEFTCYSSL
jgi:hypothetical protein